jgi:hypothetical protein
VEVAVDAKLGAEAERLPAGVRDGGQGLLGGVVVAGVVDRDPGAVGAWPLGDARRMPARPR